MILNPSQALAAAKALSELNNIGGLNLRAVIAGGSREDNSLYFIYVTLGRRNVWLKKDYRCYPSAPDEVERYMSRQAFFKAYGLD